MPGPMRPRPSYREEAPDQLAGRAPARVLTRSRARAHRRSRRRAPSRGRRTAAEPRAQPPRSSIVNRLVGCGNSKVASDLLDLRPVAVLAEDRLHLGRVEEVDEGLRWCDRVARGRLRDRVLDEDRRVRHDVLERLAGLLREDGLVLVPDEHIALARGERREGLAGAAVHDGRIGDDLLEELARLVLALAGHDLGLVGGEEIPLRAARRERVRRDDRDVLAREVVPAGDALRVAGPVREDDDAVADDAAVLVLVPVGGHDARLDEALDVRPERERHEVGRQARLDRAALVAGARVRLLELDARSGLGGLEERDDLLVHLARRRVGGERHGARRRLERRGRLLRRGRRPAAGRWWWRRARRRRTRAGAARVWTLVVQVMRGPIPFSWLAGPVPVRPGLSICRYCLSI